MLSRKPLSLIAAARGGEVVVVAPNVGGTREQVGRVIGRGPAYTVETVRAHCASTGSMEGTP